MEWTFNIDATIGAFGFHNSFYTDPKPEQPSGDLGDNWFEGAVKPALTATYTSPRSWQVYGKVSVVGERTYGADPTVLGEDASSFGVEDLAVGWRSGDVLGDDLGTNVLELTVGRAPYELGHGFLIWDGAAEGGTRGGYWTNARKAFELAAIGKFTPGHHTVEAFYLDKDDLPEADSESRLWGANYEYAIGEDSTIGATYMSWSADTEEAPERDGLEVYNLRVFTAPFSGLRGLSFEAEYAREDNGEALDSYAWTALAAYEFGLPWSPRLSYRYAFFEGDDPDTLANESFDPLFTGFYDWGTWWQGEIAGEYFVSNSNLISHQLRLHTAPLDAVESGLILYDFRLHRPAAFEVDGRRRRARGGLVPGLERQRQRHHELPRRLCRSGRGGRAVQRADRRVHLRNGLLHLQLLEPGEGALERQLQSGLEELRVAIELRSDRAPRVTVDDLEPDVVREVPVDHRRQAPHLSAGEVSGVEIEVREVAGRPPTRPALPRTRSARATPHRSTLRARCSHGSRR